MSNRTAEQLDMVRTAISDADDARSNLEDALMQLEDKLHDVKKDLERVDNVDDVLEEIEEKLEKAKNGKGLNKKDSARLKETLKTVEHLLDFSDDF